jgi:ankyrin repeat protein
MYLLAVALATACFSVSAAKQDALVTAAEHCDVRALKAALASGEDVNARVSHGRTLLAIVVADGYHCPNQADTVQMLIAKGADVNSKDDYGQSVLHSAVGATRPQAIPILLIDAGADVNATNSDGMTPLWFAGPDIARILIAKGANINARDKSGQTALTAAITLSDIQYVQFLIAQKADVNFFDNTGQTPLLHAVGLVSKPEIVRSLITAGADVEATKTIGTPLVMAAQNGNLEDVKLLMEAGANIHARTGLGVNAMAMAALLGHADVVAYLIDKGSDVDERFGNGSTALEAAAMTGQTEVVKTLIAKQANVNAADGNGMTPYSQALANNHPDIAELLKDAGATSNTEPPPPDPGTAPPP